MTTPQATPPSGLVTAHAVIRELAQYAENIAFGAGVGSLETAGQLVSFLYERPSLMADFMAGKLDVVDTGALDHHNGWLSWHGMDGSIYRPDLSKARFPAPPAEDLAAAPSPVTAPDAYDAGLLGDYGGGDIEWWQSYIRLELARAHEFYASQWPFGDDAGFWKQRFQVETRARIEAEERLSSPQHPVGVREALEQTGCLDEADLIDMANVGRSLMERIANLCRPGSRHEHWAPMDDPAEIVFDLANMLDEAEARATLAHPPAQDAPGAVDCAAMELASTMRSSEDEPGWKWWASYCAGDPEAVAMARAYHFALDPSPPQILDETSLRSRIGEIGNQVHNIGCEHQNDEPLSDQLAALRDELWALAQQASIELSPPLPEADGEPDDLTAVYMFGFERGKDAAREKAEQVAGLREAPDLRALRWDYMPSYGELDFDQLREAVSEANIGDRHHLGPFDPAYFAGHQQVGGCNYNSLNRIVTTFVRAALRASTEEGKTAPSEKHKTEAGR